MNTLPPSFIEYPNVLRDDNMGLVVLVLFVSFVLLVNLVSIAIEHLVVTFRQWRAKRQGGK